jgi:hypothetical protein
MRMSSLLTVFRYAWALPCSAVGFVFLLAAWSTGAAVAVRDGTLEVAGGRIRDVVARLPRFMQFHAITLGHVVLACDEAALDACREHERVHVRQYERWGPAFFPLYLGSSLVQLLLGRDPYRDNRFEREAFASAARGSEATDGDNGIASGV